MNGSRRNFLRNSLKALYEAALSGADAGRAVARALERPSVTRALCSARRIGIFAVGKAAAPMLDAAPHCDAGLAILPRGYRPPRHSGVEVLFASHPSPDRSSVAAARRAISFFRGFEHGDTILCLISGGTSALLCLPREGITLGRKRAAVGRVMASGASIVEINRLRKRLSAVKGGKLGRMTRARLVTLVLSDVPGDDPALVGSGPTVRWHRGDIVLVVGSNRSGLQAAAREALRQGLVPRLIRKRLAGEAVETGRRFARSALALAPRQALLAGGETTVMLSARPGRGGRNLEFALGAASMLEGENAIALLAAGSDGIDGSSRAAGAFADGTSLERARRCGLNSDRALTRHDTERFFASIGDLFVSGPTETNVCDWVFAIRRKT